VNSYDACSHHINGHTPSCLLCEIDTLRSLLRQVANAEIGKTWIADWTAVWIPQDLWQQIAPLRNGDADASR